MKNSRKIAYGILGVAGICAVMAFILVAVPVVSHAQDYYGYDSYDGSYGYDSSYDGSYGYDSSYGGTYGYDSSYYPSTSYDYVDYGYSGVDYGYGGSYYGGSYVYPGNTYVSYGQPVIYGSSGTYRGGTFIYNGSNPITYNQPTYNPPVYSPIVASCYATPSTTYVGNTVQWYTNISGGTGSYAVTWSGDEGLSGSGTSISKTYYNTGLKYATITVTSGSQSRSIACQNPVTVSPSYNYNYNYNYNNYSTLSASCVANTTYAPLGSIVTWSAAVSGGNGYYTYNWYGTDNLYGSGQSTSFTYNNAGIKTAYVTVSSNGQTYTATCSNSVNVGATYSTGYVVRPITSNTLDIGCFVDPNNTAINQPVTWTAEVTGGIAPYTYSWTGSDGLVGTANSVVKTYSTSGTKNAIVTVRSADGKTGTRSCSNTLAIRGAGSTNVAANTGANTTVGSRTVTTVTTVTTPGSTVADNTVDTNTNGSQMTGSAIFSFNNVPWGWIAILIILVLFATVMYLVFNRQKI